MPPSKKLTTPHLKAHEQLRLTGATHEEISKHICSPITTWNNSGRVHAEFRSAVSPKCWLTGHMLNSVPICSAPRWEGEPACLPAEGPCSSLMVPETTLSHQLRKSAFPISLGNGSCSTNCMQKRLLLVTSGLTLKRFRMEESCLVLFRAHKIMRVSLVISCLFLCENAHIFLVCWLPSEMWSLSGYGGYDVSRSHDTPTPGKSL